MKYERPIVLASYKVAELMKDAAVCTCYGRENLPLFGRRG